MNGRGGTAAVQGYYRDDTKAWLGRLSARGLDAAHWLGYFSRPGSGLAGGGRARGGAVPGDRGRPEAAAEGEGKIRLRQATLRVPGTRPLTEAEIGSRTRQILGYRGRGRLAAAVRFWGDSLPA